MAAWSLRCATVLAMLLFSGCTALKTETTPPVSVELPLTLRLLERGAELDVPVPVLLIGFTPEFRDALDEIATQERIKSNLYLNSYSFALGKSPVTVDATGPYTLLANYTILAAPSELEAGFFEAAKSAILSEAGTVIYDANKLEDWLGSELGRHGLAPNPNTPTLVLVHGGDRMAASHAYRYTLPNGYMQPVRVFGERLPMLSFDVSAAADPYVVGADGSRGFAYDRPIARPTKDDAPVVYELITHASHFRLLQGPLYPPSLKGCHAITLVQAYEVTSAADLLPTVRKSSTLLDKEGLTKAFAALMAPAEVHVDVKTLVLPRDDAVLHAMLHASQPGVRWWIDQNWAKFWVPHEGCEAYVSFLWHPLGSGGGGQALYSFQDDRRFSISSTWEVARARDESMGTGTRTKWDLLNMLYAHETGHLLGLRHPHDITNPGGPTGRFTFSSIWSTMSYQQSERISQFGAIETNNLHRNRAGLLLVELQKAKQTQGADFEAGVSALSRYEWRHAEAAFERALAQSKAEPTKSGSLVVEWEERFDVEWTGGVHGADRPLELAPRIR